MTGDELERIRECARRPESDAKTVKIACRNGDVLQGIALFVSYAERDVIFRVKSSNNPAKYPSGTVHLIEWDNITDFQELN
jgi:hypothetical protein